MKKLLFLALIFMAACNKGGDEPSKQNETTEHYIDASAADTWHYFSLESGVVVGTSTNADETAEGDNTAWRARKDWDIAIQRYRIRTAGGVFTPDGNNRDQFGNILTVTSFASIEGVPAGAVFALDKPVEEESMSVPGTGGVFTTVVRSDAGVVQMWRNSPTGPPVMPPDYRAAPVYIFRSADGKNFYKVKFTEYKNDLNVAGHVTFNAARIYLVATGWSQPRFVCGHGLVRWLSPPMRLGGGGGGRINGV